MKPELVYGTVWEDAQTVLKALKPVALGNSLLSIASAGDNVLALLTLDPNRVIAIDSNPAQIASLELRMAAFAVLDSHEELLRFLGVVDSRDRLSTYARLRNKLSPITRTFWDRRPHIISVGIIHGGRFEQFLRFFAAHVLPRVHGAGRIHHLMSLNNPEEQKRFYDQHLNTWQWRLMFRLLFNSTAVRAFSHSTEKENSTRIHLSDYLLDRTRLALTSTPVRANPYIRYVLTGNFDRNCLPYYLRLEHHSIIRSRLDRLVLITDHLERYIPDGLISGFNLSNVFDHMDSSTVEVAFRHIRKIAAPGSRVLFWTRQTNPRPPKHTDIIRDDELSAELYRLTQTPSYSYLSVCHFHPESVRHEL